MLKHDYEVAAAILRHFGLRAEAEEATTVPDIYFITVAEHDAGPAPEGPGNGIAITIGGVLDDVLLVHTWGDSSSEHRLLIDENTGQHYANAIFRCLADIALQTHPELE